MTRNTLLILATGSLILFTAMGWGIMNYFGPITLSEVIRQGKPMLAQLGIGCIFGLALGLAAWLLIGHTFFDSTRDFFTNLIGPLNLSWLDIILVSCCAGIGEEILFRGGIQPWLGIGWTSLLFVLLHGYINPFNWPLTVYGIFMVLVIAIIGWAAIELGLVVAITAHAVIDVVLLHMLTRNYSPNPEGTFSE